MSPNPTTLESLQTVAACLAAVNTQEFEDLDQIVCADVTVMMLPGFGPARPITGIDGVATFFAEARKLGVTIDVEPYEIKLDGARTVLVHADYVLKNREDEQRLSVWIVYRLRDGLIASIVPHVDRDAALRDVQR